MRMFITSKNKYLSNDMKIFGTCSIPLTMPRNPINFLYNRGQVTLLCVKVGPVANSRQGSTQEHDWARVDMFIFFM